MRSRPRWTAPASSRPVRHKPEGSHAGGGDGTLARTRRRRTVRARDAELIVTDDEESAAKRVAELLAEAARAGSEIALTGGSTPAPAYGLAARLEPNWTGGALRWGERAR